MRHLVSLRFAKLQKGKRMTAPTQSHFEFLQSIDTPTVCNLVEIVAPERRGSGYTVKHLHCPFPDFRRSSDSPRR